MSEDQFKEMMEVLRAIGRQLEQMNDTLDEIKSHAGIDILSHLEKLTKE